MTLTENETAVLAEAVGRVFGRQRNSSAKPRTQGFIDEITQNSKFRVCEYRSGEIILNDAQFSRVLGFVISGSVSVTRGAGGVILNTIAQGGVFGAATLFSSEKGYSTAIRAKTKVKIATLEQSLVEDIFAAYPASALSYIRFLSDRVRFLNKKIACFTAESAESRLALFLVDNSDLDGCVKIKTSISKLALMLGIGRASLYRSLDLLSEQGLISRGNKSIVLIDREKLEQLAAGKP